MPFLCRLMGDRYAKSQSLEISVTTKERLNENLILPALPHGLHHRQSKEIRKRSNAQPEAPGWALLPDKR